MFSSLPCPDLPTRFLIGGVCVHQHPFSDRSSVRQVLEGAEQLATRYLEEAEIRADIPNHQVP